MCHSVGDNNITGDAANHLATVVLDHAAMTDFCGIPLTSLREDSITELDLKEKGIGMPGAIVLSKLLPSTTALKSLKCAKALISCKPPALTPLLPSRGSLGRNQLCAVGVLDYNNYGTYTTEGIATLCEGLKFSAVTSLK